MDGCSKVTKYVECLKNHCVVNITAVSRAERSTCELHYIIWYKCQLLNSLCIWLLVTSGVHQICAQSLAVGLGLPRSSPKHPARVQFYVNARFESATGLFFQLTGLYKKWKEILKK